MLWTGDSPLFDFSALTLSNDDVGDVGDVASLAEAFANCDISFVERRAGGDGAKDPASALAAELGGPFPPPVLLCIRQMRNHVALYYLL
jgi:hypothetical protein